MIIHRLFVEFEFIVDLDMALYKLIHEKYNNPSFINQSIINKNNENDIIKMMLYREHINPLELFVYGESTDLYNDFINNHTGELLEYAKAYDTFALFITFINSTNTTITVLCSNEEQERFIKSLSNKFDTIISVRENVSLINYDAVYLKYYSYAVKYNNTLKGKMVYIANANYNIEPGKKIPIVAVSAMVADVNIVRLMDLYKDIKYKFINERNE